MAIRTVTAEEEGLASAIADTEQEIFSEANGNEPLENDGDKSLEQMGDDLEGRTNEADEESPELEASEEATDKDETEKDANGEAESDRDEKTGQFVRTDARIPSGRLREESERRRAAESEAITLKEQIAALNGRLDQLSKSPQQQQTQTQKAEPPDMFSDPEGWQKYQTEMMEARFTARIVESSLGEAAEEYGDDFQKAYRELQQHGLTEKQQFGNSPTVNKIWNSPNPGRALMNWHSQQNILREVGNDPDAYRDRLRDDLLNDPKFIAEAVERARGSARTGNSGQARTITRLPASLNGQTGGSHLEANPDLNDPSEASVFRFATQ